jgi:hypothetical protein
MAGVILTATPPQPYPPVAAEVAQLVWRLDAMTALCGDMLATLGHHANRDVTLDGPEMRPVVAAWGKKFDAAKPLE